MVTKVNECDIPGCSKIATRIIDHDLQVCCTCYQKRSIKEGRCKKPTKKFREHKVDKIIETYLNLAEAVQKAGESVSVIKDHMDKPLSKFLEEICSANNIRFKHDRN